MSVARVMVVRNYRLLKSVGIRIVSDMLLRHHQSLIIRVLRYVALAIFYAEGVSYVDSVVRLACDVT